MSRFSRPLWTAAGSAVALVLCGAFTTRAVVPTRSGHTAASRASVTCCRIVELRHYTVKPGTRDTFIALFDREFVESQEAVGMQIIAQFRDIDRPDAFIWLRGFPDMPARAASLNAFYFGPVWAAHRGVANPMLVDNDDVRLLHPARPGSGFVLDGARPAPGATAIPAELVVATIYTLDSAAAPHFADFFERTIVPRLTASGTQPFGVLETEHSVNTFPRLPVREGEHAFVWFARYADPAAHARTVAALAADPQWRDSVQPALGRMLRAPAETWRLTPTARARRVR